LFTGALPTGSAFAEEYIPGQALILLRDEGGQARALSTPEGAGYVRRVAKSAGGDMVKTWGALSEAEGKIFALVSSDTKSTEELIATLKADPRVLAVSPNFKRRALVTPNDPRYSEIWGLRAIRADEAWADTTGRDDIYAGVMDTGVYPSHEDLAENLAMNLARDFTGSASGTGDAWGHGTHVSGIIGAVGNNALGVTGISWKVRIIPLKVLGDDGTGTSEASIDALNYIIGLLRQNPEMKIPAVNMSLGGWVHYTPAEAKNFPEWHAFRALDDMDRTVIVVAAGNEMFEVGAPAPWTDIENDVRRGDYIYPASYPDLKNMIVVTAIDESGRVPTFSNWSATHVHLIAPGTRILSTASPRADYNLDGQPDGLTYYSQSGTSMATPHVTGAVTLLASAHPDLSASKLKSILLESANSGVNPSSTASYGQKVSSNGLLDIRNALNLAARENSNVPATGITIAQGSGLTLQKGDTITLSATVTPSDATNKTVAWSSDAPSVARVDATGQVTALAAGRATITAQALGASASASVVSSIAIVVTEPDSGSQYTQTERSDSVQQGLDAVNAQTRSRGVTLDFGGRNGIADWTPSAGNQTLMTFISYAAFEQKSAPAEVPSGQIVAAGKPSIAVNVAGVSGSVALVPLTMKYTLTAQELNGIFEPAAAAEILANPSARADVLFEKLSLQKEIGEANFVNLVPGAISPANALSLGLLSLEGSAAEGALNITFSFLLADDRGTPVLDGKQLIVPDGAADGYAKDPLWLLQSYSSSTPAPSPSPEPDDSETGAKSGGGCNGGLLSGVFFIPLSIILIKKLMRRRFE
jgi:subtilisin family serine protease